VRDLFHRGTLLQQPKITRQQAQFKPVVIRRLRAYRGHILAEFFAVLPLLVELEEAVKNSF